MSDELPPLSVLGVNKAHAMKAVRWLRARSILAFYRAADRSLNAWVIKSGSDATYKVMNDALEATR